MIELAVSANSRSRNNEGMEALINADEEVVAMVSDKTLFHNLLITGSCKSDHLLRLAAYMEN